MSEYEESKYNTIKNSDALAAGTAALSRTDPGVKDLYESNALNAIINSEVNQRDKSAARGLIRPTDPNSS